MLEQVLRAMNNWFVRENHTGTFTIADGRLALPFLQNGQYFLISGSVFNDGLYQHPDETLTDETFEGCVAALAVPKSVIELSQKVSAWEQKNGAAASGVFQSESFAGYSYTKATGQNGKAVTGWADAFASELNRWRKL